MLRAAVQRAGGATLVEVSHQTYNHPNNDLHLHFILLTIRRRVDWCCVPQYSGGTMVEVLRSKLFYARARIMVVLPTFHELPKVGLTLCISTQAARSRVCFRCTILGAAHLP